MRKSLFALGLWQPRRCRSLPDTESRSVAHDLSQAVIEEVNNNNERRNVDMRTKLSVGWLNVQSLRNKPTAICETIDDRHLDVAVLTETYGMAPVTTSVCVSPLRRTSQPSMLCGNWTQTTAV